MSGSSTAYSPPLERTGLASIVLVVLAVLQGLFFLLPISAAAPRLIGVALTLASLLAMRRLRDNEGVQIVALASLGALIFANFVWQLVGNAPNFPFRLWQLMVLFGYVFTAFAGIVSLISVPFRTVWFGMAGVGLLLLVVEGMIGGPADFSPASGKVEWVGATLPDTSLGLRFVSNSTAKTFYPDNPRGYFDEPDALQRRWLVQTQEGSNALLRFPQDRRGVMRVDITDVPGRVSWHVALTQAPIKILGDERYEVRFRARADSARTFIVAVGQAHDPWSGLGLYREVRVDTTWREFSETFRASLSDRNARLYFEVGAEKPSVELMNVTARAISTDQEVQAQARRELSVSYRINSRGCRGNDFAMPAPAGTSRILTLGDGVTFGVGVHENDTWSGRLQALLNEPDPSRPHDVRFDVINCGVRGASARQTREWFKQVGPAYTPALAIVAINPSDDRFELLGPMRQGAAPVGTTERLFHLWGVVRSLREGDSRRPNVGAIVDEIKQLNADAGAMGTRLAVVLMQTTRTEGWTALDSALTVGLRGENVPVLSLGKTLLAFGEQKLQVHPVYDGHPNELAHRVAAGAIRKFLADQGLLGSVRLRATATDSTARRP